MKARLLRTLLLILLSCVFPTALAQIAPNPTIDSIDWRAVNATLIVRGKVESSQPVEPALDQNGDWRTISFKVDETLKGAKQLDMRFVDSNNRSSIGFDVWKSEGKSMLLFLNPSSVSHDWLHSRFPYVVSGVLPLEAETKPVAYSADGAMLTGQEAILAYLRRSLKVHTQRSYEATVKKLAPPKTIRVPVAVSDEENWNGDPPATFTNNLAYDGRRIIGPRGSDLCVWDATNGRLIRRLRGSDENVYAVAVSPDGGHTLATSGTTGPSKDYAIREWDLLTGKLELVYGPPKSLAYHVEYVPGTNRILSACRDIGTTHVIQTEWDQSFGEVSFIYPGAGAKYNRNRSMVLSGDFGDLFDSTGWIVVWDTRSHLQLSKIVAHGEAENFHYAAFSPYGNRIVTASRSAVQIWNAEDGKRLLRLPGPGGRMAEFTSDNRFIVAATTDGNVTVWDALSGQLVRKLPCPANAFELLLSPDGKLALAKWGPSPVFLARQGATVWDLYTGKPVLQIERDVSNLIGFSPDSERICLTDVNIQSATIWNAHTGKLVANFALEK